MDWDDKKVKLNPGHSFFDKFGGELWEICPLNNGHYCRKKTKEEHLEECKAQTLKGPRKVECPYNALHIVNLMEIEQHMLTCENRVAMFNSLCDIEPKREMVEGVKMEPLNVAMHFTNEWDDGKNPERGYDAMDSTKFRAVIRPTPPGLSKKQRKEWNAKERQRFKWLAGETKEKPRGVAPYPTPHQIKNAKAVSKEMAAAKEEVELLAIIDGLGSANIADPRNAMMKRINAKLKVLQVMEAKLKEEKLELQRQVEQYLASIGTVNDPSGNGDPRRNSSNNRGLLGKSNDNDPRTSNHDHMTRILPDIMTSAMIR